MTDYAPTLQAMIDYAMSQDTGGRVEIPPGIHRLETPVRVDYSFPDVGLDIVGAGQEITFLDILHNGRGIEFIGEPEGGTISHAKTRISDFSILGGGTGAGIEINGIAFASIDRVTVHNFHTGIRCKSVVSSSFNRVMCEWNRRGVEILRAGGFSGHNACVWNACHLRNNSTVGMRIYDSATCIEVVGGSIEGNGVAGNRWTGGISANLDGRGGGVGIELHGVYIESNGGGYDLIVDARSAPSRIACNVFGGTFNRVDAEKYPKVPIQAVGNVNINLFGPVFADRNDYPGGNPYHSAREGAAIKEWGVTYP